MGWFDFWKNFWGNLGGMWRKKSLEPAGHSGTSHKAAISVPENSLEEFVYSGMRVEVMTLSGQFLFAGKIRGLHGNRAELHTYVKPLESKQSNPQNAQDSQDSQDSQEPEEVKPIQVKIRGYNNYERKAVGLEGVITQQPGYQHIWQVEELTAVQMKNDRAFFRLETDLDAILVTFNGVDLGEYPCKLLNISVGGACVSTEHAYQKGDKFLLKVKLLEEREVSEVFCQVLRVTEKPQSKPRFEYGCQFIELNEADQERITESIFAAQRKKRNNT